MSRDRISSLTSDQEAARERVHVELDSVKKDLAEPRAILFYLALSSRLEAIGDTQFSSDWQALKGHDLFTLLRSRFQDGIRELAVLDGDSLGHTIIEAQDFYCFMQFHGVQLATHFGRTAMELQGLHRVLDVWCEDANSTLLDPDALETIELYRELFPIPDNLLLPVIAFPMLPGLPLARPELLVAREVEIDWASAQTHPLESLESREKQLVLLDSGRPAGLAYEAFADMVDGASIGNGMKLYLTRSLQEDWSAHYDLRIDGQQPVVGTTLRVGPHAAWRDTDAEPEFFTEFWRVPVPEVPAGGMRLRSFLAHSTIIRLTDGTRVRVRGGT